MGAFFAAAFEPALRLLRVAELAPGLAERITDGVSTRIGRRRFFEDLGRTSPLPLFTRHLAEAPESGSTTGGERDRLFEKRLGKIDFALFEADFGKVQHGGGVVRAEGQGALVGGGGLGHFALLLQADALEVMPARVVRLREGGIFESGGGGFVLAQSGVVPPQLAISRGLVDGAFAGVGGKTFGTVVQSQQPVAGGLLLTFERRPLDLGENQGRRLLLGSAGEAGEGDHWEKPPIRYQP